MIDNRIKVTVYSCIASYYDMPHRLSIDLDCIDSYKLFTDGNCIEELGWEVNELVSQSEVSEPNLINRYHKFFPHRILSETDISIYIDGNIRIVGDIAPLLKKFLESDKIIGVLKHPQRTNIIEECFACFELNKFKAEDKSVIVEQIEDYVKEGFKLDSELYAATVIFRRHADIEVLDKAMSLWWRQINKYCSRDQISLPYILWKTQVPYEVFDIDIFNNPYFQRMPHRDSSLSLGRKIANKCMAFLKRL